MWNNKERVAFLLSLFGIAFYNLYAQNYKYPYDEYSRDPLDPLVSSNGQILIPKEGAISDFLLQGVIFSEEGSRAVINNEILRVGDIIKDYHIFSIGEKKVILKKGGKEFILKLDDNEGG